MNPRRPTPADLKSAPFDPLGHPRTIYNNICEGLSFKTETPFKGNASTIYLLLPALLLCVC